MIGKNSIKRLEKYGGRKSLMEIYIFIATLAEKTVSNYVIWLDVLEREFGDKILHNITRQDIESYRDGIARNHTNVNANNHLSVFKKLFTKAIELKAVFDDPAAGIPYLSEKHHI